VEDHESSREERPEPVASPSSTGDLRSKGDLRSTGDLRVVLGVSGGIAAYKACSLLRRFTETGHDVRVVPTAAALQFVGAATWAALSGNPVSATVWDDVHDVPHVRLGQEADLVVVAPATADLLARAAHGLADDLLTSTLLTARCPVLLAPAMHTEMWEHPATRANVATLRERGVVVLEPASGRLTGADTGKGRLPEPEAIFAAARRLLVRGAAGVDGAASADLAGRHVVVSAGGTREPLDPVRFLGNRSSGLQGYALAATAAARGARVTLVAANSALESPAGVDVVPVQTALDLRAAVLDAAKGADVVVMAAAVADFRPAEVANHKIKKTHGLDQDDDAPVVRLVRNPDVLADLVAERAAGGLDAVLVGFAAETGDDTGDVLHHATEKLARKGCDLLVVNDVSAGQVFGHERNAVTLLRPGGEAVGVPEADKSQIADAVWDAVLPLLDVPGVRDAPDAPDRHGE
jgi:phosphopantothenoylcysteine decarboxylase/phosphopantothenate--cysteine ligase